MNYLDSIKAKFFYIYYFIVYSFVGWCLETAYVSITQGRFINRGLINIPLCPIYGFGALLLIVILMPLSNNIALFFLGSIMLTTTLEYATGYVMETFFNIITWDYSREFLNINGRICLKFSIVWGLLALFFLNLLHPHIDRAIDHIPAAYRVVFCYAVALIFIVDGIFVLASQGFYIERPDISPVVKQFTQKLFELSPKHIDIF